MELDLLIFIAVDVTFGTDHNMSRNDRVWATYPSQEELIEDIIGDKVVDNFGSLQVPGLV